MGPALTNRQQELMARILRECETLDDAEPRLAELDDVDRDAIVASLASLGISWRRRRKTIDLRRAR
jgi:hypothetical protein